MTELTTKSSGSHHTHLKTILVILVFFLVITGITEAQISSEVKINNGEIDENYSVESYNQSWNWTYNGYANQTAAKGVTGAVYVVAGGGGGAGGLYNNGAENTSTVVTPAVTSQVVETPSDAWEKVNTEIANTFEGTATILKIMAVAMVAVGALFIVARLRTLNTGNEETGSSGGGHTPYYYPTPDTSPMKYEPPKPKKPVDRDGVEDDDSSFIEVLD